MECTLQYCNLSTCFVEVKAVMKTVRQWRKESWKNKSFQMFNYNAICHKECINYYDL